MFKKLLYFFIFYFQIKCSNKLIFLDPDSNVELAITPTHIDANIKHNVAGYIIIAFGKKDREKICPGDFVFVTYDDVPII